MTVAILDYGLNNLKSIVNAVARLGHEVEVQRTFTPRDALIIPGVGAFGAAMRELAPNVSEIRRYATGGGRVLGICLGQQLLFESSEEHGSDAEGLGLIPGRVCYLPASAGLKVPHMGWTKTRWSGAAPGDLSGREGFVYFVHSLHCVSNDPAAIIATAPYGVPVAAAVRRENVLGTQFHPEKSGEEGMIVLRELLG